MNDLYLQLPEFDPRPDLWACIEYDLNRLDADTASLGQAVMNLPEFEPKASLWDVIEGQLTDEEIVTVRPLWSVSVNWSRWTKLAAAAVVVLVGGWYMLQLNQSDAVQLEYSVEKTTATVQNDAPDLNDASADGRAAAFIAQQCAEQQLACQRPEVYELRNQLVELSAEQQRLARERQVFGDDPTLIQAQVRLENQRVMVTKELITLLRT